MYWGPLEELDGTPLEEPELEVSGPYITEDTCEGELGIGHHLGVCQSTFLFLCRENSHRTAAKLQRLPQCVR